jgi:hypothetical protein
MEYDFAIVYFGLTRSTKKVFESHYNNVFNVLTNNNLKYKTFMHTWKTNDNKQNVWQNTIEQEIDYNEYKYLKPDVYKLDSQELFIDNINMDNYFYKNIWDTIGHSSNGEWLPELIKNHLCSLESQKRGLELVEEFIKEGNTFKYVMFIRPDILIYNELPVDTIILSNHDIFIPNDNHWEGYNDRFAIVKYNYASIYGNRINEIAEFRKTNGRIVSEKYVKFILTKYNLSIGFIFFYFELIRP